MADFQGASIEHFYMSTTQHSETREMEVEVATDRGRKRAFSHVEPSQFEGERMDTAPDGVSFTQTSYTLAQPQVSAWAPTPTPQLQPSHLQEDQDPSLLAAFAPPVRRGRYTRLPPEYFTQQAAPEDRCKERAAGGRTDLATMDIGSAPVMHKTRWIENENGEIVPDTLASGHVYQPLEQKSGVFDPHLQGSKNVHAVPDHEELTYSGHSFHSLYSHGEQQGRGTQVPYPFCVPRHKPPPRRLANHHQHHRFQEHQYPHRQQPFRLSEMAIESFREPTSATYSAPLPPQGTMQGHPYPTYIPPEQPVGYASTTPSQTTPSPPTPFHTHAHPSSASTPYYDAPTSASYYDISTPYEAPDSAPPSFFEQEEKPIPLPRPPLTRKQKKKKNISWMADSWRRTRRNC
ncbi:hypothetical protein BT69DRAFT_782493 [Atractiella rhizophila]|nr:hypothetical protein BT69DRAFT_782493 [Atractiella rhizophila]